MVLWLFVVLSPRPLAEISERPIIIDLNEFMEHNLKMETKKIYRSERNKVLAGIFGGLGKYFNTDPVLLRLAWILIVVLTGFIPGIIAYLIAIIIVPKRKK